MTSELFNRRKFAKLALDGAVVVASILIAFALDAWWDDRQLQKETAEDLAIVQFELAESFRLVQLYMDRAKPLSQRLYVTLQDDELARWKQVAAEAATSTATWSRFGEANLIERPFNVDRTQIEYCGCGKDCVIHGWKRYVKNDAKCDDIKLIIPTDQRSACASFFIEVIVARESGEVVGMKDSFRTDFPKMRRDKSCLTRIYDTPVRPEYSLFE